MSLQFDILTLFPEAFQSYLDSSIIGRAREKKIVDVRLYNIRDYSGNKHHTVDDKPYGGGVGMVMRVDPIFRTLADIPVRGNRNIRLTDLTLQKNFSRNKKTRIILLEPRGKLFTQSVARRLRGYEQLVFICGHYEGIDYRVRKLVHEEISMGEYVLTGGELPALVAIDAVSRLLPGVLGKDESSQEESFSKTGTTEHPHYTRPAIFSPKEGIHWPVPSVLMSGHHDNIRTWKDKYSRKKK